MNRDEKSDFHSFGLQSTAFIGREDDVAELSSLLLDDHCHLASLVGPGGIGKTQLALEIGRRFAIEHADRLAGGRFADGVYFVPLESLNSPESLVTAVINALDFTVYAQQQEVEAQLLNYLGRRSLLLILDNYEQLLPDVGFIKAVLRFAPRIVLLVTSREALNLSEEWVRHIGGLQVPGEEKVESIEPYGAVKLFLRRARRIRGDFDDIECAIRICRQLEGVPLAIELAAAWLKTLSCRGIIAEIARNADILTTSLRDVPQRHQSMRAVFDHSWHLLNQNEREVFQKLAVFRGGFDQRAAEKVAGASLTTLSDLVDKSMIWANGEGRFAVHQLLRQYAEEKLRMSAADHEKIQDRHASYYSGYLRQAYDLLKGPGQIAVLESVELELDNIRAAWKRITAQRMLKELSDSVECLALLCLMHSRINEGERLFAQARDELAGVEDPVVASVDLFLARFKIAAEWGAALDLVCKGLLIRQELGAPGDTTLALAWLVGIFIRPLLDFEQERYAAELRILFEENLAACRRQGDRWAEAWLLNALADLENELGNKDEAVWRLEESITLFDLLGNPWAATFPRGSLAMLLAEAGKYAEAVQLNHEIQAVHRQMGDRMGIIYTSWRLASIAYSEGDNKRARFYIREALQTALDIQTHPIWLFVLSPLIVQLLQSAAESTMAVEVAAMAHAQYLRQTDEVDFGRQIDRQAVAHLDTLRSAMAPEQFAIAQQRGQTIDATNLTQELLQNYRFLGQEHLTSTSRNRQTLVEPLSDRELEVLRLIAAGLSNREIALRLTIAVGTVKAHSKNIYSKLGVHSRTQAVERANKLGLLGPSA